MNNHFSTFIAVVLLITCALPSAVLATTDLVESRRHNLDEQRGVISRLQASAAKKRADLYKLREQSTTTPSVVTAGMIEEARMETEAAEIELQSIDLDAQASERNQSDLATSVEQLQRKLKELRASKVLTKTQRSQLADSEQQLAEKQSLLELESEQQKLLQQRSQLTKEKLQLAKEYKSLLSASFEVIQSSQREEALEALEKHLKQEADRLLSLSAQLNERLSRIDGNSPEAEAEKRLLQTQIKEAEEAGYLLKVQMQTEKSVYTLKQLETGFRGKELETAHLTTIVNEIDRAYAELQATQSLTDSKLKVLQQLAEVQQKRQSDNASIQQKLRQEQQIIVALTGQFSRQLTSLQLAVEQADSIVTAAHKAYQENIKRSLTARHHLPSELFEWKALLQEVLLLPQTLAKTGLDAMLQYWRTFTHIDPSRWAGLLAAAAVWILLWSRLAQQPTLQALAQQRRADSFSESAMDLTLAFLRDNAWALLLCGLSLQAGWILEIDSRTLGLLGLSWTLWFGSRLPLAMASWWLLSPLVARAEWKQHIYRINWWFAVLSVLLALFLMLGYLRIITDELSALAERAFMLFIACSFLAALRIRPQVLVWLQARNASKRWLKITSLASFLFLAFMLGAALLGVVGYINLAWAMASHLAWLLLVVMGWYVVRGVLYDLVKAAKNLALSNLTHGVLWAQDIIDPCHQLLRLLLIVSAAATLFQIFGWDAESPIGLALQQILARPLFSIGTQSFHTGRLLLTGLFLAVLLGFTRWIRKFSFRWLYAGVIDIGVRNSLSVFTQYAFFLIGLLIILKTLGLDLTSLAIFTGAVGVGVGLGLQGIANNFISGIILLLERPLRAKDLVTVAGVEGEVKDLGMRAVTIKTADNQEVIIPNAEIVGHPLINWTRSDQVLRTSFAITVSYHDDPHLAREIMFATVSGCPAVLKEPAPTVWLQEFAANGISYQVQYFINIEQNNRAEMKSQMLLKLWDALKASGMTIPAPAAKV